MVHFFFYLLAVFQALGSGNLKDYSQKNLNASDIVRQVTVIICYPHSQLNLLLESKGELEAIAVLKN